MLSRYAALSCWAFLCHTALPADASEQNLSRAEIRTLKNAVTVINYLPHLAEISGHCEAEILQYLPSSISNEDAASAIEPLFQEKLNISPQQLQQLLDNNPLFAELTKQEPISRPACDEREALTDFASQYSNNLTALEISEPLAPWQHYFATPAKAPAMDPAQLETLLRNSRSQVLVDVKPKQLLTPLQQANYLHIDDKSSYVFEVQQGWDLVTPRYLGLHIYVNTQNYAQQPKRWLLLLDANFHPKIALHGAQMQQALQLLGSADWTFNRQGDLLRAKTISKP